jgi:hypothetical protein
MDALPEFRELLEASGVAQYERDRAVIYGLTRDLRLGYLNPEWFAFAAANEGEPDIPARFGLGTRLLDAISGPLQDFYEEFFTRALAANKPVQHDYECSSDQVYRLYHQSIYPLARARGLLVVNSLSVEKTHPPDRTTPGLESDYRNDEGIMVQCSHCRRFRRNGAEAAWDWAPQWVRVLPPAISHGLCPVCIAYYYPEFL